MYHRKLKRDDDCWYRLAVDLLAAGLFTITAIPVVIVTVSCLDAVNVRAVSYITILLFVTIFSSIAHEGIKDPQGAVYMAAYAVLIIGSVVVARITADAFCGTCWIFPKDPEIVRIQLSTLVFIVGFISIYIGEQFFSTLLRASFFMLVMITKEVKYISTLFRNGILLF